jgi:hypothetical protein
MLEHLGHADAAAAIVRAIEATLADSSAPRTPDLGGKATTAELGARSPRRFPRSLSCAFAEAGPLWQDSEQERASPQGDDHHDYRHSARNARRRDARRGNA